MPFEKEGFLAHDNMLSEPYVISVHPPVCLTITRIKVKEHIAVNGFPSHSYGTSLATWDHTVLPAT